MFSLFFQLLEKKEIRFAPNRALSFGKWMAISCIAAYALSMLFAKPGIIFNVIGAIAGILQLAAIAIALYELFRMRAVFHNRFAELSVGLFCLVFLSLILKSILQLVSAHPLVAELAYSLRPVVIAYLHLVLVGVITLSLLAWYYEGSLVERQMTKLSVTLILVGFVASETCLVLVPWWNKIIGEGVQSSAIIFSLSALMFAGSILFYLAFISKKTEIRKPGMGS